MPPTAASISLCLACSASLPPRKVGSNVYLTQCCSRPICPNCLSGNPRLARYNPCLRCLAGVNAVKTTALHATSSNTTRANIDGSVRDEDVFVVEDEESEPESEGESDETPSEQPDLPPPNAGELSQTNSKSTRHSIIETSNSLQSQPAAASLPAGSSESAGTPPKYFIRPEDTLVGISLKLGIDGRLLCRLNNLPPSTLRTTPHILHTRSFLILPPSAPPPPPLTLAEQAADEERRARLARERAETRFQSLTKETDRDVAKAYVALADLPDDDGEIKGYEKETGLRKRRVRTPGEDGLEGRATDQYFDDEEWEARERAEGRRAVLPAFPYAAAGGPSRSAAKDAVGAEKSWWRWRS
ncbi:hypothetical protein C2E23DRAFT_443062 [Lenzites betulinus]|nr:hypothetical protein C2E23DRAFT_443062 [Lenzites betulinus]